MSASHEDASLARTPEPPCWTVIFASRRTRGDDGIGITVCYWRSESDIAAWREHALHREAQRLGHAQWYADFELRIAKVECAYGMKSA